jgi:hypothetical protein
VLAGRYRRSGRGLALDDNDNRRVIAARRCLES